MMITINSKANSKMLEHFPNDPYSDITIKTTNNKFQLVLTYLSIDSAFFQGVDPDTKEIDLTHLSEPHLIRVLRSLYGGQLVSKSVSDLNELYIIIENLEVHDYKENIIEQIRNSKQLMNSLQMLQFSFKYNVMSEEFKQHHFMNQLKILEDNRNYLQLNKVTSNTINSLLLQYLQTFGCQSYQTINNILQNYLNRNSLTPQDYFNDTSLDPLRKIWEKFHHSIQYLDQIKQSIIINNTTTSINFTLTIQNKNATITQLEEKLRQKDKIIQKLNQQNIILKKQFNSNRVQPNTFINFNTTNGESDTSQKLWKKSEPTKFQPNHQNFTNKYAEITINRPTFTNTNLFQQ